MNRTTMWVRCTVAIIAAAGSSGCVEEPAPVHRQRSALRALFEAQQGLDGGVTKSSISQEILLPSETLPGKRLPTEARLSETSLRDTVDVALPIEVHVFDSNTDLPITGAEIRVGDATANSDVRGLAVLSLDAVGTRRLTVTHPGYAVAHRTIHNANTGRADVFLKARNPETYATVRAGEARSLRFGERAELVFAADSLVPGTELEISLADDRTLRFMDDDAAVTPDGLWREPSAQLQVEVLGADPWEHHDVISEHAPVMAHIQLTPEEQLSFALGGLVPSLSSASVVDQVPAELVAYDPSSGVLSFPVHHFSDIVLSQEFRVVGGCDDASQYLEFVQVRDAPEKILQEFVDGDVSECQESPRPLSLSGVKTLETSQTIGVKGADIDKSAHDHGYYLGSKFKTHLKIMGWGVKGSLEVLGGLLRKTTEQERTETGFKLTTSFKRSITVAGSGMCEGHYGCEGHLLAFFTEHVRKYRSWRIPVGDLLIARGAGMPVSRPNCASHEVLVLPTDTKEVRSFGQCLRSVLRDPTGLHPHCKPGESAALVQRMTAVQVSALEEIPVSSASTTNSVLTEVVTRRKAFAGPEVQMFYRTPSCPEGYGDPPVGVLAPRYDEGKYTPPERPVVPACLDDNPPLGPAMDVSGSPDSMVPSYDAVEDIKVPDTTVDGRSVKITAALRNIKTRNLGPIEEVARVAACCDQPGVRSATVNHSIKVALATREGERTVTGAATGGAVKVKWTSGFTTPIVGGELVGAVEHKYMVGSGGIVSGVIQKVWGESLKAGASVEVTVGPGENISRSNGLFAFPKETSATLYVLYNIDGEETLRSYPIKFLYYGKPWEGQEVTRPGYCEEPQLEDPLLEDPPVFGPWLPEDEGPIFEPIPVTPPYAPVPPRGGIVLFPPGD